MPFSFNPSCCFFEVGRKRWLTIRSDSGANVFNHLLNLVRLPIEIKLFSCNLRDGIVLSEIIFRPNDLFPLPSPVAAVAMDVHWSCILLHPIYSFMPVIDFLLHARWWASWGKRRPGVPSLYFFNILPERLS